MSDFCNQCAEKLGLPLGDFLGVTKRSLFKKGKSVVVLCEGCGPIQVDPMGNCISKDCEEKHG